jgi:phosphoglycerol transferase MdoB-like AlkP superfamily enzyme
MVDESRCYLCDTSRSIRHSMQQRIILFFKLMLFWLVYMILIRIVFLLYNLDSTLELSWVDVFKTGLYGFRMDASMVGYFMATYGLILTASSFSTGRWLHKTISWVTYTLLFCCTLIVVVDIELYRHWGFRLNTTPFFYLGSGAWGSIDVSMLIKTISILFIIMITFVLLYKRVILHSIKALIPASGKTAFIVFLLSAIMFLPIRGSFTVAPMNTGFVYFHPTHAFANHAAINVVWNFLYTANKGSSVAYNEKFYDKEKAKAKFQTLYPTPTGTTKLFKTEQPNIILVILESFTADVIEPLGGVKDLTPRINALCKEGVLFTNMYSSGDRTDKGMISILSGYPAQPKSSIIKFPAKTQRLPQLNKALKALGYRTSFVYGGDVDFANFRSYLTMAQFDHITGMNDFPKSMNTSKWGVHDGFMFDRVMKELDSTQSPFFKTILTLSSHEPFDVPMEPYIKGTDTESLFLNSCHYTDACVGNFIDYCKKQSWWENTVVIFTADHGHRLPGNKELHAKERFRIPVFMIGGALEKDTTINTLGSNTDIANTLLSQLNRYDTTFRFSKDLLSENVVPFAAYFFNDGYGLVLPNNTSIVYDNVGKLFLRKDNASEDDLELSMAYQQMLFSDYNAR